MKTMISVIFVVLLASCAESECRGCGGGDVCVSGVVPSIVDRPEAADLPYTPTELAELSDGTYVVTLHDGTPITITLVVALESAVFDGCGTRFQISAARPWAFNCEDANDSIGQVLVRIDWDRKDLPGWGPPPEGFPLGTCRAFYLGGYGSLFLQGRKYTSWPGSPAEKTPFVYFDDRDGAWFMCSNGNATEILADDKYYFYSDEAQPIQSEYIDTSNCLEMVRQR